MTEIVNDGFYAIAASWEDTISGSNCLIVKTVQEMEVVRERNPEWYKGLAKSGVASIILFPLKFGNQLLGYIWASNFDTEKAPQIKEGAKKIASDPKTQRAVLEVAEIAKDGIRNRKVRKAVGVIIRAAKK
jgi:GAF domain-containing protein